MREAIFLFTLTSLCFGCQTQQKLELASINSPTMVCGNCVKTIEKAVYRVEGVKGVNVDLGKKLVEVKFVPAQTNMEAIERAIADAGYDANNRKRDPTAYDKLDACCKKEE